VPNSENSTPPIEYPEKTRITITIEKGDRIVLDKLIERGVFASYSNAVKKLVRFWRLTFEGLPPIKRG